jgi:YD repeat-containing protein
LDEVINTSGTTDYDYNHRNQLASVTRTDSSVVDYEYDHGGRRTSRTIGSSSTKYVWDELSAYGDVILEADETDSTIAEYTLANGQLVSQNRSGMSSYYLYDAQGSVRSLTSSGGSVTDQ